jgi:hypothetical protein
MRKMTRAAWCGVWLFCALMIAASLDNIPDPPAVKSGTTDIRAAGVMGSLQTLAGGELRNHARVPGPRVAARWNALKHVIDTRLPDTEIALVRQAADPSPPAFVRS